MDEGINVDPDPEEDNPETRFPAMEATPGQIESRLAYRMLKARHKEIPWWTEYLSMRAQGWDWRKAAFVAWSVMPKKRRIPRTIEELAQNVLGLSTARTIRKWREKDPRIDQAIEAARIGMLGQWLPDVLEAWVKVASMVDPAAHRDRITYLETMGVYKNQTGLELSGKPGAPVQLRMEQVSQFKDWDDDELSWLITNLQAATGIMGGGAA